MLIWFSRASHLRNTHLSTGIKNNTRDKLCICEELQILTVQIRIVGLMVKYETCSYL